MNKHKYLFFIFEKSIYIYIYIFIYIYLNIASYSNKKEKKSNMMLIFFMNKLLYLSYVKQLLIINSSLSWTHKLNSFMIRRKGWLIHLNPKSYKVFNLAASDLIFFFAKLAASDIGI